MKIKQPERTKASYFSDQEITPGFEGIVTNSQGSFCASFSDEFRDWLFDFQGKRCGYCGTELGEDWSGNSFAHVEHIHNRRSGGSDLPPNLMYACQPCNVQKRNDHWSTLYLKIPMRVAGISGLITTTQAEELIRLGLLKMEPLKQLYFEAMKWPHIHMPPKEEVVKGESDGQDQNGQA